MKRLRVTNIFRKITFEGVWDELMEKKMFDGAFNYKIFETNSSFHVN